MSSKKEEVSMEPKARRSLVPALRFPEFRDAGEWENVQLREVLDYERPDSYMVEDSNYKASGTPVLTANKSFVLGYTCEEKGIYSEVPVIIFDDFTVDKKYVDFPFKIKSSAIKILKARYFNSLKFIFEVMCMVSFDAKDHKRYYISTYQNLYIPVPNLAEQQKIADCLSSIDDLITLEARKIEALKAHKKGLMQQLFPADGETIPKLRFPEFRDAVEWEVQNVFQFAKVMTGAKDTHNKVADGKYPFFVRSQKVEYIDSYSYDGEAVLTSGDGVGVGKNFHYINDKFDFHQRVYCIYDFTKGVSGLFFYFYFSEHFGVRVMRMSAKNSVDSVRMEMITEMPVLLPSSPEQERIASCLSSIDDLIALQAQKLEALKVHKKGLMQQLFPVSDEVGR